MDKNLKKMISYYKPYRKVFAADLDRKSVV